jgi:hypothetical protein
VSAVTDATGYWKEGATHNLRYEVAGVQIWLRFQNTDYETSFYGDVRVSKGGA